MQPPQAPTKTKFPEQFSGADMDYQVELVARAFYDAEHEGSSWDCESEVLRREFRGYARNAIDLLDDDIGVLVLALQRAADEERSQGAKAAA
jgi:hypothetical protein